MKLGVTLQNTSHIRMPGAQPPLLWASTPTAVKELGRHNFLGKPQMHTLIHARKVAIAMALEKRVSQ